MKSMCSVLSIVKIVQINNGNGKLSRSCLYLLTFVGINGYEGSVRLIHKPADKSTEAVLL